MFLSGRLADDQFDINLKKINFNIINRKFFKFYLKHFKFEFYFILFFVVVENPIKITIIAVLFLTVLFTIFLLLTKDERTLKSNGHAKVSTDMTKEFYYNKYKDNNIHL